MVITALDCGFMKVLDGFIIIALEPHMTAADRRRSPGTRSHAQLDENRGARGKKEEEDELKMRNCGSCVS